MSSDILIKATPELSPNTFHGVFSVTAKEANSKDYGQNTTFSRKSNIWRRYGFVKHRKPNTDILMGTRRLISRLSETITSAMADPCRFGRKSYTRLVHVS
jgi:hypothetical protein